MDTLIRLVYRSTPRAGLANADIKSILMTARRQNAIHGITGYLAYTAGGFLQALEGPLGIVNRTYGRIVRDPRHEDVQIISFARIDERRFPAWTMGYTAIEAADRPLLLKYAADASLHAVDPDAADRLLEALAAVTASRVQGLAGGSARTAA